MSVKLKQLKEDVTVNVKVNKNFYFLIKKTLFDIIKDMSTEDQNKLTEKIKERNFENLSSAQEAAYLFSILIADVEQTAIKENLYEEIDSKDIKLD